MTVPVTRTKIVLPRRRPDLLSRQRLVKLLYDLLDYRLILVAAPAGYGKTSLLIDFAYQVEWPVCWYALDPLDRDPHRFIAHWIAALTQRFPSFGKQSSAMHEASSLGSLDLEQMATAVANEIYDHIREHFLFVLDDFHLVSDCKEIESFLNRFIQEVGENCHLVLSSRTLLTLQELPLLVARSQVGGLSFEELAFQGSEIKSLLVQNYPGVTIPDEAAEELARETEGWITGLLLSAQTMWQGMVDRLRVARVSGVGLYDYLAQQVLEGQPPALREFLLKTSLLEEFDVGLCEAVFGPNEAWPELFLLILQNNLFVLPVGEDGRGIRYHHLFRDFLQSRLEIELPEEKAVILGRLAEVYASRREWDRAYAVGERLGEVETLANLVERAGSDLIKGGRMRTVAEWVDALPADLTAKRPELLSQRGVAAIVQGEVERGLALLNQAEGRQRAASDRPGLALTLARRATAQRFTGDYAAALADAIEARDLIRETQNYPAVEAEALRAAGMALYQSGRLSEAIERLSHSLALYREIGDQPNVAMVSMELGLASMSAGYYRQAFSDYQQAFLYWRQAGNLSGQANLLNNLGVLHHLMGEYEQGLDSFEEALACARQSGYVRMEAYILCGIGDLYADLGAGDAALEAYTRSREIARRIDYRFLLLYLDLAEAELARQAGSLELAEGIVAFAGRSISADESGYESGLWQLEAGRISLSRGKPEEAAQVLSKASALFETGGQRVEAARSSLYLAIAQHRAGDLAKAFSTLEKAIEDANHLESPHVLVIAGQEAKELLKTAAKVRGPAALPAARLLERVETFERRIPSLRRKLRPRSSSVPFSPPKLTIQALGRAQVDLDGKPVTVAEWQNQKRVREFFFCLLAHPNGLTKEEIGLVFWPDSSPAQLKLQFKNVIYRLRVALGPDTVLYDEDRYWFNRDLDYSYDVEVFLGYLQRARSTDTIEEQISAFEAASEIYTGIYLPEMSGSWVWPERGRLQRVHEEADLNLARLCLQNGNPNRVITVCHKLLVEDPCLEEAHRLLMEAYSKLGNQAALARQFERCCQVLKEEVHSPPSQQTRDLYEKLRSAGTGA